MKMFQEISTPTIVTDNNNRTWITLTTHLLNSKFLRYNIQHSSHLLKSVNLQRLCYNTTFTPFRESQVHQKWVYIQLFLTSLHSIKGLTELPHLLLFLLEIVVGPNTTSQNRLVRWGLPPLPDSGNLIAGGPMDLGETLIPS